MYKEVACSAADEAVSYAAHRNQRRRSRAVLYQLSGSYNRQRNRKSKLQLQKVRESYIQ